MVVIPDKIVQPAHAPKQRVLRTHVQVTSETVGSAGLVIMLKRIEGVTPDKQLARPFIFQVPPSSDFQQQRAYPWNDFDTVAAEQRSRPGSNQLKQITWDSLFLADTPWWTLLDPDPVNYSANRVRQAVPHPLRIVKQLEALAENHSVFTLTARNPRMWNEYDVNMWANIRQFDSRETPGEPDSRYYSITFSEYRPTAIQRRMIGTGTSSGPGASAVLATLTVGDLPDKTTLYDLAKNYYGALTGWRLIANANGLKIGPNLALSHLSPTTRLVIPHRPITTRSRKGN